MTRHSVIARLGPRDSAAVPQHMAGALETEIRFIAGDRRLGFGLGDMITQLFARGIVPSECAVDVGILAACVTAADTRIERAADSQDGWTREIDLHIPVQDAALWTAGAPRLERILRFLTGDRWRLFFRQRHADYRTLVTRPRNLIRPTVSSVCLFSGGLDSYVGAIDLLAAEQTPLLVSHYWELSTSSQHWCANRIGAVYGAMHPRHVRVRVGFDSNDFSHAMGTEPTTRGRSFLFFGLAAMAASGLEGRPVIHVPENGLISLNVPLDPLRVGAWSTRTTHPFYMNRWQDLLNHLGIPAQFANPYRFKTKGEMLAECANPELIRRFAHETISCSSIAKARWKGLAPGHCGFCVPCLIRRAAFSAARLADTTAYTIADLQAQPLNSRSPEGEHVRSFQLMARRLRRRPYLAKLLVHKPGPLSAYDAAEIAQYGEVFRRGIEEVAALTRRVVVQPR